MIRAKLAIRMRRQSRINASISDGGKPVVRYFVDGRFFCAIMYYIYM